MNPAFPRSMVKILLLACIICMLASPAVAQVLYGTVTGTVRDPSAAVVPGATVVLTNKDTGAET